MNYILQADLGELGAEMDPFRSPILHMVHPEVKNFRFEWHRKAQELYVIETVTKPERANLLSDKVSNQVTAEKVVGIWCSGVNTGLNQKD
jgi:hypothetical protein